MGRIECNSSVRSVAKFEVWWFNLNALLCSLNLVMKFSGLLHIRFVVVGACQFVYPDCVCLFGVCCLCISSDWMVLLVRSVIFMSVFLNIFVIKVVSFPM
jgi:hypothetical protein